MMPAWHCSQASGLPELEESSEIEAQDEPEPHLDLPSRARAGPERHGDRLEDSESPAEKPS